MATWSAWPWPPAGCARPATGDMTGGDFPGWLPTLFAVGAGAQASPREPGGPARRVRPRRLPALSGVLHREGGARLAPGRPRHRQPRPGADPGGFRRRAGGAGAEGRHRDHGAEADRVRRRPPPVRRGRPTPSRRPCRGRRRRSCGAGCAGRRGAGGAGRGLEARLLDLVADREDARRALGEAVRAAAALPGEGWSGRISPPSGEASPIGPVEALLVAVLEQLRARAVASDVGQECAARPALELVRERGGGGRSGPGRGRGAAAGPGAPSRRPPRRRRRRAARRRARPASRGALRGLDRRARMLLPGWRSMLQAISENAEDDPDFVDWFNATYLYGRVVDAACLRHWVDPTEPLRAAVLSPGARGAGDQRDPGRLHPGRSLRPGRDAHRRRAPARAAQDPAPGLAVRLRGQRPRPGRHRT